MSQPAEPRTPGSAEIQARLHTLAQMLRDTRHLGPEARQSLAELFDELGNELQVQPEPGPAVAQLADSTAHLVETLQHGKDRTLLSAARDRLNEAVLRAEVDAPFLTGIVRRLLEAMANLGI